MILLTDSEGPDQTARMRSLIWAFAVRICPKTRFRMSQRISYRPFLEFEQSLLLRIVSKIILEEYQSE